MAPSWLRKAITVFKKSSRSNPENIDESDSLQRPGVFEQTSPSTSANSAPSGDAEGAIIPVPTLSIADGSRNCLEVQANRDSTHDVDAMSPTLEGTMASALQSPASSSSTTGNITNFFPNAQGFTINKQNITVGSSKSLFDYLQSHIAVGASHNSAERCDAPKCHPKTRVAVQEEIFSWITTEDEEEKKEILWLTGPAGTGKTAIAGSIADECEDRGLLAGSFFSSFSGSADRRTKRCFVASVAYQLSRHASLESYGEVLLQVIQRDPTVLEQRLEAQLAKLILRPFRLLYGQLDLPSLPKVIVLDGVDEVQAEQYQDDVARKRHQRPNEGDHFDILDALLRCAQDPTFPFKILISSRPERVFEDFFGDDAASATCKLFLNSEYSPEVDIRLFLRASFAKVRRRYRLSSEWPGEGTIWWITWNASGQFIYAATIIQFITDASNPPQTQLQQILSLLRMEDRDGHINANPFAPLDELYRQIFNMSPDPQLAAIWIQGIAEYVLHKGAFGILWKPLLERFEGETNYVLDKLTSLVSLPSVSEDGRPSDSLKIHHWSLINFLQDRTRCGDLYPESNTVRKLFSDGFVRILKGTIPAWLRMLAY
ncbi:hypothetical protein NMY22_g13262 [Coprinellus aureogranulatus]|nr:hypothetical protein NMY22_g13262 [Coprinellus aureogranulatus]